MVGRRGGDAKHLSLRDRCLTHCLFDRSTWASAGLYQPRGHSHAAGLDVLEWIPGYLPTEGKRGGGGGQHLEGPTIAGEKNPGEIKISKQVETLSSRGEGHT